MKSKNQDPFLAAAITLAGFAFTATSAHAASYTWTPLTAGPFNWNNASSQNNWGTGAGGAFPVNPDDVANMNVNLSANQVVNLNQAITVGSLTIGDTSGAETETLAPNGGSLAFDVSSGSASLIRTAGGTGATTISANITLNDNLAVSLASGSAISTMTLSGIISESGGAKTLTKDSSSLTLVLTGANTFSGGVTIKNGTLESRTTTTTLGTGTVVMGGTGSTGATYHTGQSNANAFRIDLPTSGTSVIGANGTGSGFTLSGPITLNGANLNVRTFNAGTTASTTLTGGVTGTGNLLLNNLSTGTGKVALSGANPINNIGTVASQGVGTTANVISAVIGANVTGVTQIGPCPLVLQGANLYTGPTNVNGGTLALGASDVLPNATAVSIGAATLDAATFADTAGTLDITAATSTINLGSGAALAFADSSAIDWTGGTLNITGTLGATSLRFGNTSGGLTAIQLGKITSTGFSSFILSETGYLVGVNDSTPPTLTSIVDNKDGGAIAAGTVVKYTVTFNESMNAATISAADFVNAGTAICTIGTVTSVSATVFTVQATATSAGTLILQIPTSATITDAIGNSLDSDPALDDDTTIAVNTSPTPTLSATNIVDDKAGQLVAPNMLVTYTLTFSEGIDAATVTSADFGNAGTATITIGTITEVTPGVFTVQVTPTTTGTLQFKVNADAVIRASASNNVLDTSSAILDADTITVGSYFFWDTTPGDGAAITSGTGAWDTTAGNTVWNDVGGNVIWSQTSTIDASKAAVFGGADGTTDEYVVTIGATAMATESLTFSSSGYQITGSTLALMPTTTTNGAITVAAGKTATINSAIAYADNKAAAITVNSGATLNLGGGATNSQYSFTGGGTVNMTSGTYSADVGKVNTPTFNQSGGTFNMTLPDDTGGTFAIGSSAGQSVSYTLSGGTISARGNNATDISPYLGIGRSAGNTAYTNTLTVEGGTLNVGTVSDRAGELLIASTANSNGTLNVTPNGTVKIGTTRAANKIYFFKNGSNSGFTAAMTQSGGTVTANGIQFGGTTGTYDPGSAANLTLSGGSLYVGLQGITRGSAASTLPVTIKLQGGTIGASDNWSSSLDMKLGTTGGGVSILAADSTAAARNITLSGILSNDGAVDGTLTKTGAGTLVLQGANTFTGGVTLKNGTLESKTTPTTLGSGTVTMGGAGSTGATYLTGQNNSNAFVINAPDSGNITIGTNGGGSGFTMSGGISLNGNLTLQTFDNIISGIIKATANLTGGITGTGNVVLDNLGLAANAITITTGAINHTGSITLQGTGTGNTTIGANIGSNVTSVTQNSATSTLVLTGNNAYTGDTTVNSGVLAVNGTSIPNTGKLVIAGGKVNLTNTETVDTLFFGGVQQAAGDYTSADPSANFTGSGTLTVLSGPPAGFSSWITGTFANGTVPGGQQGPNDDFDKDGISNLVEYAIAGQDPTLPNATIGSFNGTLLSFTKASGTSGLTYAIQKSTDLGINDAWIEASGGSYVNDASTISFTLTPGTPAKNFLRLQVLSN
jgi:fibronectin-binding autotransporter adhesin